jgi:hypothetical protein
VRTVIKERISQKYFEIRVYGWKIMNFEIESKVKILIPLITTRSQYTLSNAKIL